MSRKSINSLQYATYRNLDNNQNDKVLSVYNHPDLTAIVEIIKYKFYFATLIPERKEPKRIPDMHLFNIDEKLIYNNFYDDFGPLNLGCLYKYCCYVNDILKDDIKKIVHYTTMKEEKRANAAFLVASYAVLYLNYKPEEIYKSIINKNLPSLKPFQDASFGQSIYQIKLIDCLRALNTAATLGLFNFEDFDVNEYEKYYQLRNGDLNWIIPEKFLAFLGPNSENELNSYHPEIYLKYFIEKNVAAVIRLNKKFYKSLRFTKAGISHYDMFFPDGTVPPKTILKQFLQVAENTKGAIAVHCKAGLGRTGTLIAAYMIKHYKMRAKEAIAWLRICRPGSVVGHQQYWLESMQSDLWLEGYRYRCKYYEDEHFIPQHKRGIYSKANKSDKNTESRNYVRADTGNSSNMQVIKAVDHSKKRYLSAQENFTRKISWNNRTQVENSNSSKRITQEDKSNNLKLRRKKTNSAIILWLVQ